MIKLFKLLIISMLIGLLLFLIVVGIISGIIIINGIFLIEVKILGILLIFWIFIFAFFLEFLINKLS